jgi:hypothetical protein
MTANKLSRNSSVGIATGYGLDGRGVGVRVQIFLLSTSSKPVLGSTRPPTQCVTGVLSAWVKRPGREGDYLPLVPRSKILGSIHPFPIHLHGVVLNQWNPAINLPFLPANILWREAWKPQSPHLLSGASGSSYLGNGYRTTSVPAETSTLDTVASKTQKRTIRGSVSYSVRQEPASGRLQQITTYPPVYPVWRRDRILPPWPCES